jgi:hypothetical protein
MKKADNIVFDYETNRYDAHLKEYPTSFNSKNFSIDKLKDLKNVAQPYFKSKLLEVQQKYEKLKQELSWNQRIYNAKCNFNPIIGEKYYLYKDTKKEFLSIITPVEWKFECIGAFKLNSNQIWQKIN